MKTSSLILVLIVALLSLAGCSEDCPVCPVNNDEPETPAYKGWLYYAEGRDDIFADLYMVDMETDCIVDSLKHENPAYGALGVGVSGDGRYLALGYHNVGSTIKFTRIFDAQTLSLIAEIPYAFKPLFADEDNLLIRAGHDGITLYDIPSFTPIFEESLPMDFYGRWLDERNKLVYGDGEDLWLHAYDYVKRELGEAIYIIPYPGDTCLTFYFSLNRDCTRIYYHGACQRDAHVGCYDITTGEVLWTYPMGSEFGSIAVSPDEQVVYVTDFGVEYWNSGTIYVLDAATGSYLSGISLYGYLPWPRAALLATRITFSPTGEKAYVGTGMLAHYLQSCGSVLVIDTRTHHVIKVLTPELDRVPQQMAIGPKR